MNRCLSLDKISGLGVIGICIVVILLLVIVKIGVMRNSGSAIDGFVDSPVTTSNTSLETIPAAVNPAPMKVQTGCPNTYDVVSVCSNYESCCKDVTGTECYCKHPSVPVCKSQYDTCIANPDLLALYGAEKRAELCSKQRGECCTLYNGLVEGSSGQKYSDLPGIDQKTDQICLLSLQQNVKEKCNALCSTNKNCAAYSYGSYACKMFSSANPEKPVNVFNKSGVESGVTYYQKK